MNLTLARAITCHAGSCLVQRLDDSMVFDAPLSPRMIETNTRIQPGMIVALDRDATPPTIRWRFETRPVEALAGDRLTILGREHRFTDARPEAERAVPIRAGDTVAIRFGQDGDEIEVYDTVIDGRPRHPEFLEADFQHIEAVYGRLANS
jgi:hypothetical protein